MLLQTYNGNYFTVIMMNVNTVFTGGSLESHMQKISDIVRGLSAAFSILSQARKENVRNDLGFPMAKLCGWDTKVSQAELFGVDVNKESREKAEKKKLRRQQKKWK